MSKIKLRLNEKRTIVEDKGVTFSDNKSKFCSITCGIYCSSISFQKFVPIKEEKFEDNQAPNKPMLIQPKIYRTVGNQQSTLKLVVQNSIPVSNLPDIYCTQRNVAVNEMYLHSVLISPD